MSGTEESHASCSMNWPPWTRRCGALSPGSEASAVVQRELGASLHRHEVEVLAMTVDEALDEWAVGQHRQPLRSCGVQRGFDEQCSQALTLARRVDLGVDEGDDAGVGAGIRQSPGRPRRLRSRSACGLRRR